MINGKIQPRYILKYNMSSSANAFLCFAFPFYFTTLPEDHHRPQHCDTSLPLREYIVCTNPSWYTLLSFPILSWTTHHHVKLADFSIPSASIRSTYLCPLPKLDCRVNKFNYPMFSIYLKCFVPPTVPTVCIQVSLEQNPNM